MAVYKQRTQADPVSQGVGAIAGEGWSGTGEYGQWAGRLSDPLGVTTANQVDYGGFDASMHFDPSLQGYGFDWMGQFDAMARGAQNRQIDPAAYQMLLAQAQGTAPSAAHLQLMAGLDRQHAMAQSMALSNPNISPALAQRLAGQQMSDASIHTNQQAAILRAQEQAAAQQQFAQYGLQQQALNDQLTQFYMQQGFSRDEAEMRAAQDAAQAELEARAELARQQLQADQGNAGQLQQEEGAAAGLVGTILGTFAKSDRRLKTDIEEVDDDAMREFLDALSGYRFRYKDEKHGTGEYLGVMAQDLEKSEIGRSMVVDEPDGKAIDLARVSMGALALAAHLGKQVEELKRR